MGGNGHGLGVIADRAATHGQNQIHLVLPRDAAALVKLFHRGIGHDARVLKNVLAALVQKLYHLIVDAVSFDGAASIDQHDIFPIFREFLSQAIQRVLSKIQFRGVTIAEIS